MLLSYSYTHTYLSFALASQMCCWFLNWGENVWWNFKGKTKVHQIKEKSSVHAAEEKQLLMYKITAY